MMSSLCFVYFNHNLKISADGVSELTILMHVRGSGKSSVQSHLQGLPAARLPNCPCGVTGSSSEGRHKEARDPHPHCTLPCHSTIGKIF